MRWIDSAGTIDHASSHAVHRGGDRMGGRVHGQGTMVRQRVAETSVRWMRESGCRRSSSSSADSLADSGHRAVDSGKTDRPGPGQRRWTRRVFR